MMDEMIIIAVRKSEVMRRLKAFACLDEEEDIEIVSIKNIVSLCVEWKRKETPGYSCMMSMLEGGFYTLGTKIVKE